MKKIINGRVYDSETAKRLGSWESGCGGDLDYVSEELYKTKSGLFFIYGNGGARSEYATCLGSNSWGSGAAITPISFESAKQWAEEHMSGDEYIAAFGDPESDSREEQRVCVYLSVAAKSKIETIKCKTGKTTKQIIEEAVNKLEW